jgi:hypothetical protein
MFDVLIYPDGLLCEALRARYEPLPRTYYMISGLSILCIFPATDRDAAERIAKRIARERCIITYALAVGVKLC